MDIINETTGRQVKLDLVSREEYLNTWMHDPRGKPREHFEMIAIIWDEFVNGALRTTHLLLRGILGREPSKPRDVVRGLLEGNKDYVFLY